ncbi:hypothetical protein CDD82_3350 [Ophiocordyceps australis]|uniref:Uncharacterized protein n=1 Tax=Ophiocordyceps australis TaxID=1399860 RepID=A0A2C5ZCS8_9HYPO|nr:hypothetical protein CDD82_3350 [Ophiocordyceps australis]
MRTNSPPGSKPESTEAIQARAKLWCRIACLIQDSVGAMDDLDELSSSPLIFAPDILDANDEQSLVNWFSWWAIINMEHLRTFTVIGSSHRAQIRGDISRIITVPKYLAEHERKIPELVPLTDGIEYHLKEMLQVAERQLRGSFLCLYWSPVSYWRESHGKPYWNLKPHNVWVQFSTSRLRSKWTSSKQHGSKSGPYNTFLALFYTSEGDYIPSKPPCRPWVAIFRPVDVARREWRSTELLIWDHKAWLHYKRNDTLCLEDLTEAQRDLVRYMKEYSESKHQLPLSKVWLGGKAVGNKPRKDENVLNVTLDWIMGLPENKFNDLPPWEHLLLARCWKQVEHDRSEKHGNASAVLRDADSSKGNCKEMMVFSPPQNPDQQDAGEPVSSYKSNTLYLWAQRGQGRDKGEFVFEPTPEWYRRQVNNRQGLNHITVLNWEAVKRRHFKNGPGHSKMME